MKAGSFFTNPYMRATKPIISNNPAHNTMSCDTSFLICNFEDNIFSPFLPIVMSLPMAENTYINTSNPTDKLMYFIILLILNKIIQHLPLPDNTLEAHERQVYEYFSQHYLVDNYNILRLDLYIKS